MLIVGRQRIRAHVEDFSGPKTERWQVTIVAAFFIPAKRYIHWLFVGEVVP
jgi:hypothetical protein